VLFCVASDGIKVIAQNKKARHDYFIEETYEAGIVLAGTEVKSIRQGKINLKDSYADVKQGEVYVHNMHISPYEKGNIFNRDPMRDRKLLLNRREINKLIGYIQQKGYSLIPLQIYLTRGLVKMQLAVAKGKKLYDKREDIAKRDAKRAMERAFRESQKV
jgi:SsrA-binding protein